MSLLSIKGLNQSYGGSHTLWDIDLDVQPGSRMCLMGRNGMGKTTLLKCVMGLIPVASGEITFAGTDLSAVPAEGRARLGIGYVPQGREIFPQLTVEENLNVGLAARRDSRRTIPSQVFDLFPVLKQMLWRRGGDLSGGQQQQLAIGRALMTNPRLMVLDEATEGLAPLIRADIWTCLRRLKDEGEAILVIDKNVDALTTFADRHVVIEKGRVVWTGTTAEILATPDVKDRFLHV